MFIWVIGTWHYISIHIHVQILACVVDWSRQCEQIVNIQKKINTIVQNVAPFLAPKLLVNSPHLICFLLNVGHSCQIEK